MEDGRNMHGIDVADDEKFFDERLEQMMDAEERRVALERAGRIAAHIIMDNENGGPLRLFLEARRAVAWEAMRNLVHCDPRDAAEVASIQAQVKEYLIACAWVQGVLHDADKAADVIREEYGEHAVEDVD